MKRRLEIIICFVVLLGLLVMLSTRLRESGYLNADGVHRWAEAIKLVDTPAGVTQAVTRSFPYVPTALLLFWRFAAGSLPPWAPMLISNLLAALLGTALYVRMRRAGCRWFWRVPALGVVFANPLFLWPATSGDFQALQLLLYLLFCWAMVRVAETRDGQALMTVAAICPLLLFSDGRNIYVLIALLPLIPFVLPKPVVQGGPAAGYIILLLPLAISLFACAYTGWVTTGDSLILLRTAFGSPGVTNLATSPWQTYGADSAWLGTALFLCAAAMTIPVNFLKPGVNSTRRRAVLITAALPVIGGVLAQLEGSLPHPCATLFLAFAPWCFLLTGNAVMSRTAPILAAGAVGAWITFSYLPTPEMSAWLTGIKGDKLKSSAGDDSLGRWLAAQPGEVLADDQFLDGAIAARGHARGMIFPGSSRFRLETSAQFPAVQHVLVPEEGIGGRGLDRVNLRYRGLRESGLPGYELAYRNNAWRVYSRSDHLADAISSAASHLREEKHHSLLRRDFR